LSWRAFRWALGGRPRKGRSGVDRFGQTDRDARAGQTPKRLFRRAARGADETTPALVLGGVTPAIAAAVAVLATLVLVVYFFA
jgi:hypothetical protein